MTFFQSLRLGFLLLGISLLIQANSDGPREREIGALPFCDHSKHDNSRKLVFVSTLDGKLSALNIEDGGTEKWSIKTKPGPMLSSSIHFLELTNNGQWVRMIPSLSGGLYKFNGEDIEPIPITAEHLLKSSFRYSDDLVISGGKESSTYGVDMRTGRVLYECSMNRCDNLTGTQDTPGDVVLVQRLTQTVRAIEPRSGTERWNFSVGQHDIKMIPNPLADCHQTVDNAGDIELKVIVPDGLVCALSRSKPGTVLWKHKFEFPIVSAWQVVDKELRWVDLFGGNRESLSDDIPDSPVLYIGMHNKQLYIQESVTLQRKILEGMRHHQQHLLTDESTFIPRIPWKPVSASHSRLGIVGPSDPILQITDESGEASTTALSVLWGSDYVNGNGFFLYSEETIKKKDTALCATDDNSTLADEEDDSEESVIIVSMWYWWKEITLLTIGCAIAINVLIQRRFIPHRNIPPVIIKTVSYENSNQSNGSDFVSRYLTDFEPVHCLGKGGFGIVFQAKNKIDDCHYAIKRIPLPNKEAARKRVMREVKALAKLDHHNIVRYFNAWVETPPLEWQQEQDQIWAQMYREGLRSNDHTIDLTGHVTPTSERQPAMKEMKNRKKIDVLKSLWDKVSSFAKEESEPFKNSLSDKSDSFIVFKNSAGLSNAADSCGYDEGTEADQSESIVFENLGSSDSNSDEKLPISITEATSLRRRPNSLELQTETSWSEASPSKVYLYIQMQLCQRDSLREWLTYSSSPEARHPKNVFSIFSQIVNAVEYVHLQGLIHRDLKPSNIFFSPDGQIKVGDFGLVTGILDGGEVDQGSPHINKTPLRDDRHTARVGTQLYMSPEQLSGSKYSYKVDIFSLGLILFELLVPFGTQMERIRTLTEVRENKFPNDFMTNFPDEYELLKLMLSKDPDQRLTTIGIRCRSPLRELHPDSAGDGHDSQDQFHFHLPQRRRNSSASLSLSQES